MKKLITAFWVVFSHTLFAQTTDVQDIIPYRKGNQFGFATLDKKIVISPQYDEVLFFNRDSSVFDGKVFLYASVRQGEKWGAINEKGNVFIPVSYPSPFYFSQGFFMMYDEKNRLSNRSFVIVNYKNKEIFASKEQIGITRGFKDGLMGISLSDAKGIEHAGFINYEGKIVIPFIYDGISPVSDYEFMNGRVAVFKNNKLGVLDKTGKVVVPFQFTDCNPNGHSFEKDGTGRIMLLDGSYLVIDAKGNILRKEQENQPPDADLKDSNSSRIIPNSSNKLVTNLSYNPYQFNYYIVDKNGKKISKNEYSAIQEFKNGGAVASKRISEDLTATGVIDSNDQEIVPFIYQSIYGFKNDMALVQDKNSMLGFLNEKYELVIPCQYSTCQSDFLENGFALVSKFVDEKEIWYVIDKKATVLKTLTYDDVFRNESDEVAVKNYFLVRKDNKFSILDSNFVEILPYYEELRGLPYENKGNLIAKKNGKYGIINLKNEIMVPFDYDRLYRNTDGNQHPKLLNAVKEGKEFYIKIPTSPQSELIEYVEE